MSSGDVEAAASNKVPQIFAHRGSTLLAPENTAVAFDLALALGCDVLETDVRLSRDGHVIVTHDQTLNRTTDGYGNVATYNLADLKRLDVGYHFHDLQGRPYRHQGIRFLTLDEVFEHYPQTAINIDIKDESDSAAKAVAHSIAARNHQGSVTVGSFHSSVLASFRQWAPEVRTAATREEVATLYFRHLFGRKPPSTLPYQTLQIPCSYFGIPLATPEFIQHSQSLGLQTCFWTVNDTKQMRALATLGADALVTDRPDLAQQIFKPGEFDARQQRDQGR